MWYFHLESQLHKGYLGKISNFALECSPGPQATKNNQENHRQINRRRGGQQGKHRRWSGPTGFLLKYISELKDNWSENSDNVLEVRTISCQNFEGGIYAAMSSWVKLFS